MYMLVYVHLCACNRRQTRISFLRHFPCFLSLFWLLFAYGNRALTTLELTKLARLVDHEPKVSAC